jgi:hypothetical protein
MRNATKHFERLRRLLVTFVAGLLMLGEVRPFPGVVLAHTSSPDDSAHFTYDTGVSLNVKQVSVKIRDGVTIHDITYTGSNGDTVPAYLVIPKGTLTGTAANLQFHHFLRGAVADY